MAGSFHDRGVLGSLDEASEGRVAGKAADLVGTNRQYVSDAKNLQKTSPDLLDQVRTGALTIPQATRRDRKRHGPPKLDPPADDTT